MATPTTPYKEFAYEYSPNAAEQHSRQCRVCRHVQRYGYYSRIPYLYHQQLEPRLKWVKNCPLYDKILYQKLFKEENLIKEACRRLTVQTREKSRTGLAGHRSDSEDSNELPKRTVRWADI